MENIVYSIHYYSESFSNFNPQILKANRSHFPVIKI